MKGEIYSLTITEDMIHGFTRGIIELYIPDLDVSYNVIDGEFNCFHDNENRYTDESTDAKLVKEIDVPDDIVDSIKAYLSPVGQMSEVSKWFEEIVENDCVVVEN